MNKFESKFRATPEKEYNLNTRIETNHLFSDYFKDLSYLPVPPFPMIPKELDKSVLFTGSVTTPFKSLIMGSMPLDGGFVIQPCFRAHNIELFYNDEMPKFCSVFTGLGLISKAESYEKMCFDVINFLTKKLNIELENILVRLTEEDQDINDYWLNNQTEINKELNTRSDDYYRWKYGVQDIRGRGLTMAIRKNKDYDYQDVGNIIRISKNSGKELATETGFGTETLLSIVHGLPHPISAFPIKNIIPDVDSDQKMIKIGDAIMAIATLSSAGINPGTGNLDRILRRYIKGLDFILENDGRSWDNIFPSLLNFAKDEYPNNNMLEIEVSIKKYVDLYQNFKKNFVFYVKEILNNKQIKRSSLPKLVTKSAKNKGIPVPHMNLILNKYLDKELFDIIKGNI